MSAEKITPDVETVVTVVKSAVDKILELPVESVIMIVGWVDEEFGRGRAPVVLHRTGSDGWLPTRYMHDERLFSKSWTGSIYISNVGVRTALEQAERSGATFILLVSGNDVEGPW